MLCPLLLLAAREEDAGDASLDVAGEDCFERALRETVLPLSKACLRKSCMALSTLKCGKVISWIEVASDRQSFNLRTCVM